MARTVVRKIKIVISSVPEMSVRVCVCKCDTLYKYAMDVVMHRHKLLLSLILLLSYLAEVLFVLSLMCDRSLQNQPSSGQ